MLMDDINWVQKGLLQLVMILVQRCLGLLHRNMATLVEQILMKGIKKLPLILMTIEVSKKKKQSQR